MNIIVCVKQVPDTTTVISVDSSNKDIQRNDVTYIISPYDEFAIEEALKLKEANGGNVTILTVGPESAKDALRSGLAMGCDEAIHVVTETSPVSMDSFTTAKLIAKAIEGKEYDLVCCGRQAIDDDAFQVGPLVAEMLGIAQISLVINLEINGTSVKAQRTVEGAMQVVEGQLPLLITATKGLNEPRYPSLKGIRMARKKPVESIDASSLGVELSSKVVLQSIELPPPRPESRLVDSVSELVKLLHEEAKVI